MPNYLIITYNGRKCKKRIHTLTHTHTYIYIHTYRASQVVLVVKNLPDNAGGIKDMGSIPGLGRSLGKGMATHSKIPA